MVLFPILFVFVMSADVLSQDSPPPAQCSYNTPDSCLKLCHCGWCEHRGCLAYSHRDRCDGNFTSRYGGDCVSDLNWGAIIPLLCVGGISSLAILACAGVAASKYCRKSEYDDVGDDTL